MPVIQGNLKTAMYVLQEHCMYSECNNCEIRNQCFSGFVNNPADFNIAPASLVLECVDKDVCSEYILMKSSLKERVNQLEKENISLKSQLEYVTVLRDALEKKLDEISPNWRKGKEVFCEAI